MSNLKDQLIKLGSDHPELRDHLKPVLDHLTKEAQEEDDRVADLEVEVRQQYKEKGMGRKSYGSDAVHLQAHLPNEDLAADFVKALDRNVEDFEETQFKDFFGEFFRVKGRVEGGGLQGFPDWKREKIQEQMVKTVKNFARSNDLSLAFGEFDTSGNLQPY